MSDFIIENGKLKRYTGDSSEVVVPKTVKVIGSCAFEGCQNLKKVVLHPKLREIEWHAFFGCVALREINLPPNVYLCSYALEGCPMLMDENGFIVIDGALYHSPGIYKSHTVKLPEGIRVIAKFSIDIRRDRKDVLWAKNSDDLYRIREEKVGSVIVVPASVEEYEDSAFMGDIEEIISYSTASFKCLALSDCTKLKKITVPEGAEISENIFGFREKDVDRYKKLKICFIPQA